MKANLSEFKKTQELSSSRQNIPNISDKAEDKTASEASKAVDFAKMVGVLKRTPRTGWVRHGVPRYESVADHSWRVAALSILLIGREEVDATKCMQMAVVHDLAECLVGDIAPDDNVSKQDKRDMEEEAMERIAAALPFSVLRGELETKVDAINNGPASTNPAKEFLLDLFHEYEKRQSAEAIAVKDLDLLDMIIQADEYEQIFGMDLSDFFEGTPSGRFRDLQLRRIAEEVHRQRQERRQGRQHENMKAGDEGGEVRQPLNDIDAAFICEYSKASNLSADSIEQVVKAMRNWENKGSIG